MQIKDLEAKNCSSFLRREILALDPELLACIGNETAKKIDYLIEEGAIPQKPTLQIYHPGYMNHDRKKELKENWDETFPKIKNKIAQDSIN